MSGYVTKMDFVAQQLRANSPGQDWIIQGIDRAQELAHILIRNGITDLWALQLKPGVEVFETGGYFQETESGSYWVEPSSFELPGYYFDYYGKRFGYLGTQDRVENQAFLQRSKMQGHMLAWSSAGHGQVSYVIRPDEARKVLMIVPRWDSSSDAADVRAFLIQVIAFFVMAGYGFGASTSVGTTVGSTVVSAQFAATYPAITAAIGNAAVSAVLNGGNVQAAVKSTAVGLATGGLGEQVGVMTSSPAFGNVIAAVARTAVNGGDVKMALAESLAREGVSYMSNSTDTAGFDLFSTGIGNEFDFTNPLVDFTNPAQWETIDPGFSFTGDWNSPIYTFDVEMPAVDYFIPEMQPLPIPDVLIAEEFPNADVWNPFAPNPFLTSGGGNNQAAVQNAKTPPQPNSNVYTPTAIIQSISAAALATLQVIKAYKMLDAPTVQSTARVVRPDGSVTAITNNGLINTRTPAGTVTGAKPPVGVPQATVDGNFVTNNGDGTYTIVAPDGKAARYAYAKTGLFDDISPTVLMGAVGLGLMLLRGRKG